MAEKRVFRSKKKISGTRGTFRKWSEWEVDDYVIGEYLRSSEDQYGNPAWTIKVLDAELADKKFAKTIIDQNLVLNSAGQLNKAMEKVEEGQIVKVTYLGTEKMEKGKYKGKEAHLHEVEIMEIDGEDDEPEEDDGDDL
jgi:hypothetical protein